MNTHIEQGASDSPGEPAGAEALVEPPSHRRRQVGVVQVRALAERLSTLARQGTGVRTATVDLLRAMDRDGDFSPTARSMFQDLLGKWGVATARPIGIPANDTPYWLRGERPLANHQSKAALPATADIVIIGAGLTGASSAYHLALENTTGVRIVVLEQGEPAGEASGRNGGNFELFPENSVGIYEGLARERVAFLHRRYPGLPAAIVQAESERQASAVLGLSLRNRDLMKSIVLREQIDCDFAPKGWLHLACNEEQEQAMCDEVMFAAQYGQRIEVWSRRKSREEFGIETAYLGRFSPSDGSYHPFKYVCGLLQCALRRGVELYTHVRVVDVASTGPDEHQVLTERGAIIAQRVIVATNAFTSQLFPELGEIRPRQSQIQVTERAPDRARGRVVTSEEGPVFFNQPRDAASDGLAPVLMGGGADRPMRSPSSRRRSPRVHAQLLALRGRFYPELEGRPPSAEWIGAMAFTPDQLPAIGFLRPGVIVAAGYNGYGGSFTTAAGLAAARMAVTSSTPDWVPEDVFSPRRLLTSEPLFMTARDGLWRIATSLCRQLEVVNRRITESLALEGTSRARSRAAPRNVTQMMRAVARDTSPGSSIDATLLRDLDAFRDFSLDELNQILAAATRCDLPKRRALFREGDPGDSCFILVRGQVDVTIKVRQQRHLLAQLSPGTIFGQVSLVAGEPRSVTCTIRRDALLAQLDRAACENLLSTEAPVALKFLAALNRGLTQALRIADRRLMQLDAGGGSAWQTSAAVSP
ncbi:MAG TPA: FAD-dependent oxidoreductase [Gemmatimonadaceae bacterium]|nr:FAD-dependent oxidoreductase [Gemmatimonadaceae bacterium]